MIVAVSSGLVAGVGVPAGAVTRAATGGAPQTASVPLLTETASTTALAAGADVLASAPVSAPAHAKVTFEHSAFTAQPKRGSTTAGPAEQTREVTTISRSLARTAYLASRSTTTTTSTTRRTTSAVSRSSSPSP